MNKRFTMKNIFYLAISLIFILASKNIYSQKNIRPFCFKVSFPAKLHEGPITGRIFLFVSKTCDQELRLQRRPSPLLFGKDINNLKAGEMVEVDGSAQGSPVKSLSDLPAGDYYVQALINVYTEFHRSDGHVIWAHMDQWEGQKFNISPGNIYSDVQKIHWDPSLGIQKEILIKNIIPPIDLPQDTKWVKHIKIKSELLSKFWGHPFYLGATILLPKGYDENPDVYYPVEYEQTHFTLNPSHGFETENKPESEADRARRLRNSDETGYEFYQQWISEDFPRMICVTFQHPTPYYDDSYAVNSANNGPYGDAIMTELIPFIENKFRIIKESYARVLSGGSTGGWEVLALQAYHPDFFGGSWVFFPDPVDFRRYGVIDIYNDDNAFFVNDGDYRTLERPMSRTNFGQTTNTFREQSYYESVLGSMRRSCEQLAIWEAVYGPVGSDGYPKPLWDPITGEIDHSVAQYMRDNNYDLRDYLEKNWSTLGPKLKGKMHFFCGDMDNLYLNLGVYLMEDFLKATKDPYFDGSFEYGRPMKGHGWRPMNNYQLVKIMGQYIIDKAKENQKTVKWTYK
ncbi:MAG: alpha/beta hydrolase-fold protein [Bacteroidota bacterium]|nr:alpha/beta hydrolase-fold protein [Bacteroidota bacterium]MDP4192001.1 alpha/beta hydrolase-fold protein [Bacteroidota bacterium]MDP4195773.1 alpha/beta hydrolase-fold protein [Bacteroidota bacterium]